MSKISAKGTKLLYGGAPWSTEVGQITNIGGPGMSKDMIDVSTHDDATRFRDFVAGLTDPGEIALELLADPQDSAGIGYLEDQAALDNEIDFRIQFPVGTAGADDSRDFKGQVTGFEYNAPVDGALTATASIKILGAITKANSTV